MACIGSNARKDTITEFFAPLKPIDVRIMMNADHKPSGARATIC